MYYIVTHIIKNITKESKLSYAEFAGPFALDWFVSHFWGDAFAHLMTSITKHARDDLYWDGRDAPERSRAYWVCSFSNNQWAVEEELGSRWSEASFYLALQSTTCRGTLMILDDLVKPLSRSWCLFELAQTFNLSEDRSNFHGLVFGTGTGVVNSGKAHISTTMALAQQMASIDLADASASSQRDKNMIDDYVENSMGGFSRMNGFIKFQTRRALIACKDNFEAEFGSLINRLPSDVQMETRQASNDLHDKLVSSSRSLTASDFSAAVLDNVVQEPQSSKVSL